VFCQYGGHISGEAWGQLTAVDVVVVPGAVVGNLARGAGVPSLAADPVVDVVPLHVIGAGGAVVVVNRALAIGPVRVEEAVVGAGAGLDATSLHRLDGAGAGGRGSREGREEGGEGDHGEGWMVLGWMKSAGTG